MTKLDALARSLATTTSRRRGLALLLGAVIAGDAASTEARRFGKARCARGRRCGDVCCDGGETCVLGRCQRLQNLEARLLPNGEDCEGVCGASGIPCPRPKQCLSGFCNEDTLICETPTGGTGLGLSCAADGECCSNHCTNRGICASTWCRAEGTYCDDDRDCCTLNCPPDPNSNVRHCGPERA